MADPKVRQRSVADWRAPNPSWPVTWSGGRDSKGQSVITKTIAFIKDVRSELSQVSWPTVDQLWDSTKVVLSTMILLSAVIGLFDLICARLISWMIR